MATPTIGAAIIVLIFFLPHRSNVSLDFILRFLAMAELK